jgi:ribose transport system substrate-binding protein
VKIGFANLSHKVAFAREVLRGLEHAVRDADGVELLVADNRTDPAIAIANARELIDQEIDLLIEYDGTGLATRAISRMARAADIPLIAVDIPIMGATHIGCDHDAAGTCAGEALGKWIQDHWDGQVDELLWVTNEGGATIGDDITHRFEHWQRGTLLSESLSPAIRFEAAIEALEKVLSNKPEVRQLVLPGGWVSSEEAIGLHYDRFLEIIQEIPLHKRVAVICLVNEGAIGFTRAARAKQRCDQFAVVSFGGIQEAELKELHYEKTCLIGIVNIHPEQYGPALIQTAVRILRSEPVPPAVFLTHHFVPAGDVIEEVKG